jgi:hypothetical protein
VLVGTATARRHINPVDAEATPYVDSIVHGWVYARRVDAKAMDVVRNKVYAEKVAAAEVAGEELPSREAIYAAIPTEAFKDVPVTTLNAEDRVRPTNPQN